MSNGNTKAPWFPRAATALALLSCYGTTVLIGLLSLVGVTLAINEGVWAGAIAIFAALATLAIAASCRRHRVVGPTAIAALGLGLILWVMFGSYSRVIELVGFVLLVAATLWDWRAGASRRGAERRSTTYRRAGHRLTSSRSASRAARSTKRSSRSAVACSATEPVTPETER